MTASNPPPGWYTDPAGGGGVRYWDGSTWTPHTGPGAAGRPSPAPATPRRPGAGALVAALVVVGLLLALVAWQVIGAARGTGSRTPTRVPAPVTAAPAPVTVIPATIAPLPSSPGEVAPTASGPTLTMDDGCAAPVAGTLRAGLTRVDLPAGWGSHETPLSFDCSVTAATNTAWGFGDVTVGSVDPEWNLDDAQVVAWAWDDLGIGGSFIETSGNETVDGRPALVVTRALTETAQGTSYETNLRIAVIDVGGGRRDVVLTDVSSPWGAGDTPLQADVDSIWASVRVGG